MNSETIVMCVVALILGMLLTHMLKSVCGSKVVEGQGHTGYCTLDSCWRQDARRVEGEIAAHAISCRDLSEYDCNNAFANDNPDTLAKKFSLRGLPTTIVLNKNGKELARIIGSIDFNEKKFVDWLKVYN